MGATRRKAIGLVVIGMFLLAGCSDSTNNLTGAIAVTSSDFQVDTWFTARNRVAENILDCSDFEGSERTQCEEIIEPYLAAMTHALDCSEGVKPGFDDIHVGSRIVVSDSEGNIVAVGNLVDAEIMELSGVMSCVYTFEAPSIPQSDFYSVAIGGRDPLVYRADELEIDGWDLVLYLGFDSVPTDSPRDYIRPETPNGPPSFPPATTATTSPPEVLAPTTSAPDSPPQPAIQDTLYADIDLPTPSAPDLGSAGIALGVNADCSNNSLRLTLAIQNLTTGTLAILQAGLADPYADPVYLFGLGELGDVQAEVAPEEVFFFSVNATDMFQPDTLQSIISAPEMEFYAEFESGPVGQLYFTCP